MMELNAKSPFLWDWENLFMFSSKTVEAPKKLQLVDSKLEAMEGFEAASFFSSGGRSEVGSGGSASASDFGYGSSSKSSKSASVDSSTNKELRESLLRLVANDFSLKDPNCKSKLADAWQSKSSSTTESPVHSGESLIGLMLGKRTYFEDVSVGNNGKTAASIPFPPDIATEKRSKLSSLRTESFHCQVEGCGLDLSLAKDYHRKHRVCEAHSKSPMVIVAGLERRFCQQCSRFHSLSEFDQKKRSCRRRLSDHNSRRRKPKPEIIPFNSMRLPSSLYDGRQQIAFDQVPIVQPRANASHGWDFAAATDVPHSRLGLFNSTKAGGNNELHLTINELQHPGGARQFNHSTQVAPSKGVLSDVFPEGLHLSTLPLNLDATRNLRALSLLSTNTLGSSEPAAATALNQPTLSNHPNRASQPPLQHSSIHPVSLGLPPASSGYWQGDQQTADPSGLNVSISHKTNAYNSHFQEFQLFKAPSDPNFYMY